MIRKAIALAAITVALVLGVQTGASAHVSTVTADAICRDDQPTTVVRFTNDMPAMTAVASMEGASVTVPPVSFDPQLGDAPGRADLVVANGARSASYTIMWEDGFVQTGIVVIPGAATCTVVTSTTSTIPTPTPAPVTPTPTPAPVENSSVVLDRADTLDDVPTLAFTGDHLARNTAVACGLMLLGMTVIITDHHMRNRRAKRGGE